MRQIGVILLASALGVLPAAAGELVDKAAEAEALAAQGKYVEAIAALDQATGVLWDRSPLTFRKFLWVPRSPAGYGAYKKRGNNIFYADNPMIAYAEPIGFGWGQYDDIFYANFAVDIVIRTKEGAEIRSQKDFQTFQVTSRARKREFMTFFTYPAIAYAPGEYVVETTLRDTLTGKSATFSLPFIIIPSAADSP